MTKLKIGVLASTKGTDLQAVIDAINSGNLNAEIACVISNKSDAYALERAKNHGIETIFINPQGKEREDFDKEVAAELDKHGVQLVCLIGYMRIVSEWFVNKYKNRLLNVHPSLLPKFAGGMDVNVHEQVLKAGEKETGCTIHFVTEQVDGGPIIVQKKVPVLPNDTAETLKARVQEAEKIAYVEAIKMFSEGSIHGLKPSSSTTYEEALNYLNSLEQFGSKPGLERTELLLKKLGNPEKSLKCFHITGTNGKGSVCAMISSILQAAGYKVGMYTSPHLVDFRERFLINNKKIPEEELAQLISKIKPLAEEVAKEIGQPTHFEVTTALAFEYFKEKNIDYLVLEVGLGGRLDSTNVIETPLVSVITNVDYEHTDVLGDTLQEIAFEKAGIIKNGAPVVTAVDGQSFGLIKRIAELNHSKLIHVKNKYNGKIRLVGEFQKLNAALAVSAIKASGVKVREAAIKQGIIWAYWPGRLDLRFISGKQILFDAAHNPACVSAILPELKNFKRDRLILIASILKDKDYKTMLETLSLISNLTILAKVKTPRSASLGELEKFVQGEKIIIPDSEKAIEFALGEATPNDLILVTGSIYLLGEIMGNLNVKVF